MTRDDDLPYSTEIGVDGVPIDSRHPANANRTVAEALERFIQRELSSLRRAHFCGNFFAIVEAIEFCAKYGKPLPTWLSEAVLAELKNNYFNAGKGSLGRLSRSLASDRQAYIHYWRWSAVEELRRRKEELKLTPEGAGPRRPFLEPTWEAAYENASNALKGTIAEGSPDTVKKSYQKVERATKKGEGARYYFPYFDFPPATGVRK
jgi:hypothetical protein